MGMAGATYFTSECILIALSIAYLLLSLSQLNQEPLETQVISSDCATFILQSTPWCLSSSGKYLSNVSQL